MLTFLRKIIRKIRSFLVWLWNQEGTPGERARGLAAGVFSGFFPLFGVQMVLAIIIATLIKGNRLLAVSGTWISNPMTYFPLYWFNYFVGSVLLGQTSGNAHKIRSDFLELSDKGFFFLARMLVGSALTGTILGLIIGIFIYLLLKYKEK